MPYVYSTATCSTAYVKYKPQSVSGDRGSTGHNQIVKKVVVNGGHGISNKFMITPIGVVTKVSDEDLDFLLQDDSFQRHMKAGFVSYDKKRIEPEKKAENMALKDGSSPLTPKDFEEGQNDGEDLRVYKGIPKSKAM